MGGGGSRSTWADLSLFEIEPCGTTSVCLTHKMEFLTPSAPVGGQLLVVCLDVENVILWGSAFGALMQLDPV